MKFVKGMLLGGMITAGAYMMYSEGVMDPKKIIKKGRKMAKKIGIM
jgi:hypothetical protein